MSSLIAKLTPGCISFLFGSGKRSPFFVSSDGTISYRYDNYVITSSDQICSIVGPSSMIVGTADQYYVIHDDRTTYVGNRYGTIISFDRFQIEGKTISFSYTEELPTDVPVAGDHLVVPRNATILVKIVGDELTIKYNDIKIDIDANDENFNHTVTTFVTDNHIKLSISSVGNTVNRTFLFGKCSIRFTYIDGLLTTIKMGEFKISYRDGHYHYCCCRKRIHISSLNVNRFIMQPELLLSLRGIPNNKYQEVMNTIIQ